jgi:hypothetical protein
MKTAEEFYEKEDPDNNLDYDLIDTDYWYFGKEDMILFAERYANAKLQESAEKAEYLKSDREATNYWRGYNQALIIIKQSILSLQIKQK